MEGAILFNFTPKGETANRQNYCDVLRAKLKPATRSKRRGILRCKIPTSAKVKIAWSCTPAPQYVFTA
jgi:hypothetical protein